MQEKAAILYDAIDSSGGFYRGHAERGATVKNERHVSAAVSGAR